jgi:hypothetical protein
MTSDNTINELYSVSEIEIFRKCNDLWYAMLNFVGVRRHENSSKYVNEFSAEI